ncbi:DNA-directed RNA polymerase subunit alpha [Candidatus Adlerbacteria bacterium RIFCSPHIGHO2_01_FULL_54_23]|uniref:DNA-directed RNA polymerase subunit alpha n=3 Tax=Candidatus Adleribacteriota TaxID=1752736 RepID=A0A1F4Y128_9BACT|nr:MAG: DNA-directed RNA polymerase subunit alpha [Candidatus Adlerbacteria bacterium GW2011_GWA1_54_10]KKW37974.1 MAG: DNA-directed RNA polymerase subunit alpha [Candidatus Adlerbacteria bacterium GW2011_GWB1_54_7]OGC78582.1 MAG: DNA-directed RNA polymerase subunit alpha [Candidatus Adlerbacteria bacterium RIFCSPHIGHO2_01_FULL_54_23]OGC87591.1 MAG: DNA-directed RNA polymerase subunit alpha [Candidatus Adlerbacteria bacterium RIFCSPLOWO2_01_FULL_54_16]
MMEYSITLPSKPRAVSEAEFEGTYEIDGLYPGYGHTLGNSLRRIILSSLPGAAITSVNIEGVQHEFSTLDGMREDVISLLLNLKKLRFEILTQEPQTITLSAKGPKKVLGADLSVPGQLRLLNPSSYLCELTGKQSLDMRCRVERGLGYVPREQLKKERVEIGEISVDAIFSPIRRVNYEVENMRVGDRTDFNRLRISIETDGTLSPRKALEQAIEIMINQLKAVVGFREETLETPERTEEGAVAQTPVSDSSEALKTRIEDLELSSRTISALEKANIRTVGGLARKKEQDLMDIEGLGPKSIQEIKRALANFGIVLK